MSQSKKHSNFHDTLIKGTMSHLQANKNEKVKFQLHLKDNTNLELP